MHSLSISLLNQIFFPAKLHKLLVEITAAPSGREDCSLLDWNQPANYGDANLVPDNSNVWCSNINIIPSVQRDLWCCQSHIKSLLVWFKEIQYISAFPPYHTVNNCYLSDRWSQIKLPKSSIRKPFFNRKVKSSSSDVYGTRLLFGTANMNCDSIISACCTMPKAWLIIQICFPTWKFQAL